MQRCSLHRAGLPASRLPFLRARRVLVALAIICAAAATAGAQDPASADTLLQAVDAAQRAELRARTEQKTAEDFHAWRQEFGARMGELAARWQPQTSEGEELLALARLWAYAARWAEVDAVLSRYLAGAPSQPFVARCERVRARARAGLGAGAREDLEHLLRNEPRRFDLALFLYGLPALVEPEGRALGTHAARHLEQRYAGDAYAPIAASFGRHIQALGRAAERPQELGRTSPAVQSPAPVLRLVLTFRTSAPLTRAPLPFLKELGARFGARGLAIELAAPREGAAFWERFRPASTSPSVEEELAALRAMLRALELPFSTALLGAPSELEERHDLRVLPHFALLDAEGRTLLFACGGEGYEWLADEIERLLDGERGAARRAAFAAPAPSAGTAR